MALEEYGNLVERAFGIKNWNYFKKNKFNTSKSGNTEAALKKRFFQKCIRNLFFEV